MSVYSKLTPFYLVLKTFGYILMAEFPDLSFDDAYVFVVSKGPEAGHAWLVDPLYDGLTSFTKFSSNMHAGDNSNSLVGRTCDALAHFSYFDSEESLVLVDIQGKRPIFLSQC